MSASKPVADEFDLIRRRISEIHEAEQLRCPTQSYRTLHDCQRNPSRCGDSCPYRGDWIGPQS